MGDNSLLWENIKGLKVYMYADLTGLEPVNSTLLKCLFPGKRLNLNTSK